MASVVRILPSVAFCIEGGGVVTLDELQSFIDQARKIGVPGNKPLETAIKAPYHYDQRDHDPGSFSIVAS